MYNIIKKTEKMSNALEKMNIYKLYRLVSTGNVGWLLPV